MAFAAIGTFLGASAATAAATGAVAVGTAASLGKGAYDVISGAQKQSAAQKRLDEQARNSPIYKPDTSINQYYQEALNRYTENPRQSAYYQQAVKDANRTAASGISALQDRRSAIGGISRLGQMQNDALSRANVQAENYKQQQFNQLAGATNMKSGDYQRQFDYNQMTPYNRQLQLEQMKAQAAGEQYNAGNQMIGQGLNNLGTFAAAGGFNGGNKYGKTNYNTKGLYQGNPNDILPINMG